MKLKWFQIRVIHIYRIIATNVLLKRMEVVPDNLFTFCIKEHVNIQQIVIHVSMFSLSGTI